jgi:hypothetical protein
MANIEDYKLKTKLEGAVLRHTPQKLSEGDKERLLYLHKRLDEIQAKHRAAVQPIIDEINRISSKNSTRSFTVLVE